MYNNFKSNIKMKVIKIQAKPTTWEKHSVRSENNYNRFLKISTKNAFKFFKKSCLGCINKGHFFLKAWSFRPIAEFVRHFDISLCFGLRDNIKIKMKLKNFTVNIEFSMATAVFLHRNLYVSTLKNLGFKGIFYWSWCDFLKNFCPRKIFKNFKNLKNGLRSES